MKTFTAIFIIVSLVIPIDSKAEYRAFMLHVVNSKTKVVKQIISALDPEQYRTYFPLSADEKITYVQTWRCFGRTDSLTPICNKPDKKPANVPSQSPENTNK